jgi:Ca2+-binding EF-hand superfamily protein
MPLSAEDLRELREIFSIADIDKSGSISLDEFVHLAKMVKLDLGEVTELITQISADGQIRFDEFCDLMNKELNPCRIHRDQIAELFKKFQKSSSASKKGCIKVQDLIDGISGNSLIDPMQIKTLLDSFKDSLIVDGNEWYFKYEDYLNMI